jgi:hypothetical protein
MGYYDVDKMAELNPPAPSTHTPAQPGYGSVPEYLVSSLPYVTASDLVANTTYEFRLPYVTRFLAIHHHGNSSNHLRIGFTKNGVENGYCYLLDGGAQVTLDLRVTVFYLRADNAAQISFCAGLTAIPAKFAPVLTGSVSGTNGSWPGVG